MIVLELKRTYHNAFCTGEFSINGVHLCFSIELPWKDNQQSVSCIPEGFYPIRFRTSPKFSKHLHIPEVKDRKWILIHPANDAQKELKGCIAPVMELGENGTGKYSCLALGLILRNLEMQDEEGMFLRIIGDTIKYSSIKFQVPNSK